MKNIVLKTIIALVFLAIFNVIFFLAGIPHSEANWYTYGFITFSYLCLIITPLLARGTTFGVLSGSLWLRAFQYFFAELVVGIIFLAINPESITWPLIVQGVMLSIFIVMQLMSVLANDATEKSFSSQQALSFSKQTLIDQLQMKSRQLKNFELKPLIFRCLDSLTNSPLETFPDAMDADLNVSNSVNSLCNYIDINDEAQIREAADKLMIAIQNRNLVIKQCRMR